MQLFFEALHDAQRIIRNALKQNHPHDKTRDELFLLKKRAEECSICGGSFNSMKADRRAFKWMTDIHSRTFDRDLIEIMDKRVSKMRVGDHDVSLFNILY